MLQTQPKQRLVDRIFSKQVIEDHASKPRRPMLRTAASMFTQVQGMDLFTKSKGVRTARSIQGSPSEGPKRILKKSKHAPFWQLTPDESTIERLYDPEEEPLLEFPK